MKRSDKKMVSRTVASTPPVEVAVAERRVATPNPDLVVVRTGKVVKRVKVSPSEQAFGVLKRVAKAMKKPGTNRASVFASTSGKPVFAYFLYSKDPTKVVREDAAGRQTVGRLVGGRFRSTVSSED